MSTVRVDRWLFARLTPLAPTFAHVAPPDVSPPYIVFTPVAASDRYVVGAARLVTECRYQVLAVVAGSSAAAAEALADAIDSALHGQSDPAAGIVACTRERALELVDQQAPQDYRMVGGEYVIVATGI